MPERIATAADMPKRMKDDQLFRVPHFPGCFGEVRTAIWKPKILRTEAILNPKGYRFVVGPDLYLNDAVIYMLRGKTTHKTKHVDSTGRTTYFFKNYASARKMFLEACNERLKERERILAEYNEAKRKANSDDPQERLEGANELLDF